MKNYLVDFIKREGAEPEAPGAPKSAHRASTMAGLQATTGTERQREQPRVLFGHVHTGNPLFLNLGPPPPRNVCFCLSPSFWKFEGKLYASHIGSQQPVGPSSCVRQAVGPTDARSKERTHLYPMDSEGGDDSTFVLPAVG